MNIYIGNISYDKTEAELLELLAPYDPIFEFNYPRDADTGKQRGFAFASIPDLKTAEEAIRSLNGSEFGGRMLRVKEAVQNDPSPPRGFPVGFRKSGEDPYRQSGPRKKRW